MKSIIIVTPTFNFISLLSHICISIVHVSATDTLNSTDSLNINQTLISTGGKFKLGFFTKGNPVRYYLGIQYNDLPRGDDVMVWVANRDSPSSSSSTTLKIGSQSKLVIMDEGSQVIWSSSQSTAQNPVLQLLDSGNLVLREAGDLNPDNYLWQSFDHPTDTLLPAQKLGWNMKMGLDRFLTSWAGQGDPGTGNYSLKLDYHGDPEVYLWNGGQIIFRSGPWVGQRFSGAPEMKTGNSMGFNFTFYTGLDEAYYTFELPPNDAVKSRLIVSYDGFLQRWTWVSDSQRWTIYWYNPKDYCDKYNECGSYGVCNVSLLICQCLPAFQPKNQQAWQARDGSHGCRRDTQLDCGSDGFLRLENMKLPETGTAFVNTTMSLDQCRHMCKKNCDCTAYASAQVVQTVGSGCVIWTDDLTDMRDFVDGGQDLYVRVAVSDLENLTKTNKSQAPIPVVIAIPTSTAILTLLILGSWILMKRKKAMEREYGEMEDISTMESFQFDMSTIRAATHNFSIEKKLGEGGFGEVYKGKLENGQEVAVKRLLQNSKQGVTEFKTEVILVAKLQHKNLVRLLGFCVTSKEKILVYEYLPNSSLDRFLFDQTSDPSLSWQTRLNIIIGIARGLMYLHEDSRLKVIHRDLKTSNILLDDSMNPKISDFGLARLFGEDQTQGDTKRIVGTYGYMAPEYAITGHYSVKSDIYSFGVIVFEIISGRKNQFFGGFQQGEALLHRAWRLWNESKPLNLVDTRLSEDFPHEELLRCYHIGLLCIQEDATQRPRMRLVLDALIRPSINLPEPTAPHFFGHPAKLDKGHQTLPHSYTGAETITDIYPRD